MPKPDLLLFFSDQHHVRYSGFAGDSLARTPNLDALAKDGTVFESAYTSCPICVPARCSFLTTQLPSRIGIFGNTGAIRGDQPTFMHSLAAEGYETVLCGRMHFKGINPAPRVYQANHGGDHGGVMGCGRRPSDRLRRI